MWILVLQRIFFEAVLDLLYFPLWWYTGGVWHALKWAMSMFQDGNRTLLPLLWLKNLTVPMFGQYDWQGRIISFIMRFIQFVVRSIALLFWFFVCIILFCIWLILPVLISYGFLKSIVR